MATQWQNLLKEIWDELQMTIIMILYFSVQHANLGQGVNILEVNDTLTVLKHFSREWNTLAVKMCDLWERERERENYLWVHTLQPCLDTNFE